MEKPYETAGKRIREERERKGYSRECLAELCEISGKHLYEIECNAKGFSARVLYELAKNLGVSCDYILEGKVTKTSQKSMEELNDFVKEIKLVVDLF